MVNKFAGENTIQAVIDETKKLTHSEVAIGIEKPSDEDIKLFVKEDEEGTSPIDFYTKMDIDQNYYTKTEVNKIKNDLLTAINNIYGFKLLTKGEVEDPGDHPNSSGGYDAQSVTVSTSNWGSGIFFVDCKMQYNPEQISYVGSYINNYIGSLDYLGGNENSGYAKVEITSPTVIKFTARLPGCGKLYYNIWMLPFIKPV